MVQMGNEREFAQNFSIITESGLITNEYSVSIPIQNVSESKHFL